MGSKAITSSIQYACMIWLMNVILLEAFYLIYQLVNICTTDKQPMFHILTQVLDGLFPNVVKTCAAGVAFIMTSDVSISDFYTLSVWYSITTICQSPGVFFSFSSGLSGQPTHNSYSNPCFDKDQFEHDIYGHWCSFVEQACLCPEWLYIYFSYIHTYIS